MASRNLSINLEKEFDLSTQEADELLHGLHDPLTSIQVTATDLYDRGLNVFPIPRPEEVREWADRNQKERNPISKPPYLNRPLFTNRLHKCNKHCAQRKGKTGHSCLPINATFDGLFEHANIAVMLGRTSGNLLAIDCDTHKAFKQIRSELEKRNIPFWSYTSHRGGGYLMRLQEGEAKNQPSDSNSHCPIKDVEIYGNRHYVVLPPSLHPLGTFYQWVPNVPGEPLHNLPHGEPPPIVNLSDLDWLGVTLAKNDSRGWESPDIVGGKQWTIFLSQNNRRILNSVLYEGSRNNNLTKPTYDIAALIKEGLISYSEGLALLEEAVARCRYPIDNIRQMLRSALNKDNLTRASDYYQLPNKQSLQPWEKALHFAASWNWTGRTAATDYLVFLACIQRAYLDNSNVFRCSEREIAELSNRSRTTVRYALRRLRGHYNSAHTPKVLDYVSRDIQSNAALYRFAKFPDHITKTNPLIPLVVCGGLSMGILKPSKPEEKDLFWRRPIAWKVWRHLCRQSARTKSSIAKEVGASWSSVDRSIKWLMQFSLVTYRRKEKRYYGEYFTNEALGEIAKSIGIAGRSEHQRAYHEMEREKRINVMMSLARKNWVYR